MIDFLAGWAERYEHVLAAALIFACLLMITVQYVTRPARHPHGPGRHRRPNQHDSRASHP